MEKKYEYMTRAEKVNFLSGQIAFGERMQGGFAYSYKSPVIPYLSTWFKKEYGKYETDWIETLKALAANYGIEASIVSNLVEYELKSQQWNRLVDQYDLVSNSSKILTLLTNSNSIIKTLIAPGWNTNSTELTERIDKVKLQILNGTYDYKSFYFFDFNTKSPQGELWDYFRGLSFDLKSTFQQLSDLIDKEIAAQHAV